MQAGGEGIIELCVKSDSMSALHMAERVRSAIAEQAVLTATHGDGLYCMVTIGVPHGFSNEPSLEHAMQQANAALYRGKDAGRNRIELHQG